jgi:hypothetical protein
MCNEHGTAHCICELRIIVANAYNRGKHHNTASQDTYWILYAYLEMGTMLNNTVLASQSVAIDNR